MINLQNIDPIFSFIIFKDMSEIILPSFMDTFQQNAIVNYC